MPTFVAIDGEGLTRPDGTHDYTLLAASDGSYIETYDIGGLSTKECFDYLLDLGERHDGAVLVGFYTSYDVNMIFRDITAPVLERLWLGEIATWRIPGEKYQYRLEYVPNRILKLARGFWYYDENDRPHWHKQCGVIWWDCFQFFQMSFVKALKDWRAAEPDVLAEIETMKNKRGSFDDSEKTRIKTYCISECQLLVGMMAKVASTLEGLDIKLTSWYGAGSIANALLRREGVKKHLIQKWELETETDSDALNEAVMSAYFGGRVETFAIGVVDNVSYNYDIRSAYPAAIAELPSLKDALWSRTTTYRYEQPYAIWHVKWHSTRPGIRFTPFPFRQKKRIYWPHTGEGYYWAEEVRAAFDVFGDGSRGIELSVIDGWILRPQNDAKPLAFTRDMYEERAVYKRAGDPREKILKLAINSEYGKFAQSIGSRDGKPPPFQCYTWGGMITADCRARIMRAAATVDENNLLAIATDGLFTKTEADVKLADELGAWEKSIVEPGLMLIQPGVYATPSLGKSKGEYKGFAKTRGFSGAKLRYPELLDQWLTYGMTGKIEIEDTRFIGFGYALAVNKLDTLWRRWISGVKLIGMGGTSTKYPHIHASADNRLMLLASPDTPPESPISAPYSRRERGRAGLVDFEIQATLVAEQPDLEDNIFSWK